MSGSFAGVVASQIVPEARKGEFFLIFQEISATAMLA
jgi:hypothetical protein